MDRHLNRLNNEEAAEFDKAFEEFCRVENKENKMTVYLVETGIDDYDLQPISVQTNWGKAHNLINGKNGRITEIVMDEVYEYGLPSQLRYWDYHEEKCPISGASTCDECSESQIEECSGEHLD